MSLDDLHKEQEVDQLTSDLSGPISSDLETEVADWFLLVLLVSEGTRTMGRRQDETEAGRSAAELQTADGLQRLLISVKRGQHKRSCTRSLNIDETEVLILGPDTCTSMHLGPLTLNREPSDCELHNHISCEFCSSGNSNLGIEKKSSCLDFCNSLYTCLSSFKSSCLREIEANLGAQGAGGLPGIVLCYVLPVLTVSACSILTSMCTPDHGGASFISLGHFPRSPLVADQLETCGTKDSYMTCEPGSQPCDMILFISTFELQTPRSSSGVALLRVVMEHLARRPPAESGSNLLGIH
ncbi:unnamed protein product [Pleuronectes platessa]|uniref:Uncharacterized protein n=1 Tax=Pleuronectes platessa TaxID=8262 RepID=A0A9N7VRX7_PLEPL|nr:unnamed protein product [Pleuronectes platessa]